MAYTQNGGYLNYLTPRRPGLASAAANPFGLQRSGSPVITPPPVQPPYRRPLPGQTSPVLSGYRAQMQPQSPQPIVSAASVNRYDINTDPALLQAQSLLGMSDRQAESSARQREADLLLNYGDPGLINKLLGDPSLAKAAAGSPTSTVAQLGQQRGRNLHDLTEQLNQNNLLYSGYRVNQETQAAQDYQNALAQAAAGVNSQIGGIQSNLAAAKNQNAQTLAAEYQQAYESALAAGIDPTTGLPLGGGPAGSSQPEQTGLSQRSQGAIDYARLLQGFGRRVAA